MNWTGVLIFFFMTCFRSSIAAHINDTSIFNQNEIPVTYQLLDREAFQKIVVGNTIVGITRQSHSLYMLFFASNGYCELWKQNQVYAGNWWIEKDEFERDFVRAFWPEYTSSEPKSLFFKGNRKSNATSVWYYVDTEQPDTLHVANKKFRASVLLVPGKAFPKKDE